MYNKNLPFAQNAPELAETITDFFNTMYLPGIENMQLGYANAKGLEKAIANRGYKPSKFSQISEIESKANLKLNSMYRKNREKISQNYKRVYKTLSPEQKKTMSNGEKWEYYKEVRKQYMKSAKLASASDVSFVDNYVYLFDVVQINTQKYGKMGTTEKVLNKVFSGSYPSVKRKLAKLLDALGNSTATWVMYDDDLELVR